MGWEGLRRCLSLCWVFSRTLRGGGHPEESDRIRLGVGVVIVGVVVVGDDSRGYADVSPLWARRKGRRMLRWT